MKRRSFLQLLATAVPAAAVVYPQIVQAQTLGLGGGIAPSNRINLGLIGSGNQGMGDIVNFLGMKDVQVVAACDVDRKQREEAKALFDNTYANRQGQENYRSAEAYLDYEELLARPDIDAVLVATPDHWHALPVLAAARAGKHIFCEKPVANTIEECRAMVAGVERSGVVCQVGNMQRSAGNFRRAINLARGGYLGRITRVAVGLPTGGSFNNRAAEPAPAATDFDYARWLGPAAYSPYRPFGRSYTHYDWRWYYDFGGGQLSDWICHHYDIAVLALGLQNEEVAEIRQAKATFPDLPVELRAAANFYSFEAVYRSGPVIAVNPPQSAGGIRIEGTEGWIYVTRGITEQSPNLTRLPIPTFQQIYGTSTSNHYENFIECIRTGATPRSPIAEVSRVTTVAHLANAAFRSGRENITWDAAAGRVVDAPDAQRFLTRTYRAPYSLTV